MANDLTRLPWILDTADPLPVTRMLLRVPQVRWVGASDASHTAILKDASGRVVWSSTASQADNPPEESMPHLQPGADWDGLIVDTLGSGKLYVTLA